MSAIESLLAPVTDGPLRTCIGCRKAVAQAELLRVVAIDGVLTADPTRRLGGRGAYVHPRVQCLDLAERKRAFGRALRLAAAPSGLTELRSSMSTTQHAGA